MDTESLALRVSALAEAIVSGVLRAMAAREEFTLPADSTFGGCMPVGGNGNGNGVEGTLRISITLGAPVKFGSGGSGR
jgi:hypothetical protein